MHNLFVKAQAVTLFKNQSYREDHLNIQPLKLKQVPL